MSDYEFCRVCNEVDYSCQLICSTCDSLMWWLHPYADFLEDGTLWHTGKPIPGTDMMEAEYMEKVFWPQRRRIQIIDRMNRRAPILSRTVALSIGQPP